MLFATERWVQNFTSSTMEESQPCYSCRKGPISVPDCVMRQTWEQLLIIIILENNKAQIDELLIRKRIKISVGVVVSSFRTVVTGTPITNIYGICMYNQLGHPRGGGGPDLWARFCSRFLPSKGGSFLPLLPARRSVGTPSAVKAAGLNKVGLKRAR